MLSFHNLGIIRKEQQLFKNLGCSLLPGACLLINGSNGSGKTSLLRILATLITQYEGEVLYNKIDFYAQGCVDEYRNLLSYIPHEEPLLHNFTVYENLKFWANLYDAHLALNAAIHAFSLNDYLNYPLLQLSKGWCKKVLLTKLLLCKTQLWLLDEPYVNLDTAGQEVLNNMITARCSQGGIVIIATNQPTALKTPLIMKIEDFR